MYSKFRNVLLIICVVLYVALLPWGAYVALPYFLFSGWVKYAAIYLAFIVEAALGVYLTLRQYRRMRKKKTTGSKIIFGLTGVSFAAYVITAGIYLIQVLLSSI